MGGAVGAARMTLIELFIWWMVTFTPFTPAPEWAYLAKGGWTDWEVKKAFRVQCVDLKCTRLRFLVYEDGERLWIVWNEAQILEEINDSLKNCEPMETDI